MGRARKMKRCQYPRMPMTRSNETIDSIESVDGWGRTQDRTVWNEGSMNVLFGLGRLGQDLRDRIRSNRAHRSSQGGTVQPCIYPAPINKLMMPLALPLVPAHECTRPQPLTRESWRRCQASTRGGFLRCFLHTLLYYSVS